MRTVLKHVLIDQLCPAYWVALKIGMSEVRLSKIANGLIKAKPEEKNQLSKILDVPVKELFPEENA